MQAFLVSRVESANVGDAWEEAAVIAKARGKDSSRAPIFITTNDNEKAFILGQIQFLFVQIE